MQKGLPMSDLDRYQYGYDQNSNRLWKANVVGTAAVTAGLAAIPLAFAAYNAWKVQDAVRIEPAPPTVEPGPWQPCEP